MLKIFSTQLNGYFKKIMDEEEFHIEEGALLLSQALIGDGNIYIHGTKEMAAIGLEATQGKERLEKAKILTNLDELTSLDRVLLISRYSTDADIIAFAKQLQERNIPTVAISIIQDNGTSLQSYVDVHIDAKLTRGLIPAEDGSRFGYPSIMTALFAYYGLKITIKEIMSEYV